MDNNKKVILNKNKIKEHKKYISKYNNCYKYDCFVPFSGNGIKICRLWELGQCTK